MTRRSPLTESARAKKERIHSLDLADGEALANAQADPTLLFSLEELALLLKPLMGIEAPRDEANRILEVRPKGPGLSSRSQKLWDIITPLAPVSSRTFATSFLRSNIILANR